MVSKVNRKSPDGKQLPPPHSGGTATCAPFLPAQYLIDPNAPQPLPDRVVYVPGRGLVPHIPSDPDLPHAVTANGWLPKGRIVPRSGLTPRVDAFARLVARGVSGADALRACWPLSYGQKNRPTHIVASRASVIKRRAEPAISRYRAEWERENRQQIATIRDFVLSRLTMEAQSAPEANARIRALDLLGKSEGMWTTVVKHEQTMSPDQLNSLKAQLEQRLKAAMSRLGQAGNPDRITCIMENPPAGSLPGGSPEIPYLDPHHPGTPPYSVGSPSHGHDTNPLPQFSDSPHPLDGTQDGLTPPGFLRRVKDGQVPKGPERVRLVGDGRVMCEADFM